MAATLDRASFGNLLHPGHAPPAPERDISASTVSVLHAYSKGSRVNAPIDLGKKRIPPTGMVQVAAMASRPPQKRRLASSTLISRTIRLCLCLHIRLRQG